MEEAERQFYTPLLWLDTSVWRFFENEETMPVDYAKLPPAMKPVLHSLALAKMANVQTCRQKED